MKRKCLSRLLASVLAGVMVVGIMTGCGEQKTQQVTTMLNKLSPDTPWDSLGGDIRTFYNYDSMLVSAVKESGNTIVCNIFDSYQSYKHESQWRPLSTAERADEVGYGSTFEFLLLSRNSLAFCCAVTLNLLEDTSLNFILTMAILIVIV